MMMKILGLAALMSMSIIITILPDPATPVEINCQFRLSGWWEGPLFYECEDTTSSILSKDDQSITSLQGTHQPGKTNSHVVSFYAYRGTIRYFPKGLENYFQNLEYLGIVNEQLQEIHREDLRPFTKLRVLYLDSNEIEFLEENLFEFTKNLEALNVNNNRIRFVDFTVFRNLHRLKFLWFELNVCYSSKVSSDLRAVRKVVNEINQNCYVSDVLDEMRNDLRKLRMEIENLRKENLGLKDEVVELRIGEGKCEILRGNLEKCENEVKNWKNLSI